MTQKIAGKVIDFATQEGIEWLKTEVWMKTPAGDVLAGTSLTNSSGKFNVIVTNPEVSDSSTLYYKVYEGDRLLSSTDTNHLRISRLPAELHQAASGRISATETVHLNAVSSSVGFTGRFQILRPVIEVRRKPLDSSLTPVKVESILRTLGDARLKGDIVSRINSFKNGGLLYFIDPLRLLAEVGVELSDNAKKEFMHEFENSYESVTQLYNSLRNSNAQQRVKIKISSPVNAKQ